MPLPCLSISIQPSQLIPGENVQGKKGASNERTGQKKFKGKGKKAIAKAKEGEKSKLRTFL